MKNIGYALSVAALFIGFGLHPANAQTQCGPLPMIEGTLRNDFGEKPLIEWELQLAEGAPQRVARIYANTETGSLTILIVFEQNGQAIGCMGGAGQNMRIAPQFKPSEHPL